jgi:hypothetical protein
MSPTLGEIHSRSRYLWLHCENTRCLHYAAVPLAPYVIRWGPDASNVRTEELGSGIDVVSYRHQLGLPPGVGARIVLPSTILRRAQGSLIPPVVNEPFSYAENENRHLRAGSGAHLTSVLSSSCLRGVGALCIVEHHTLGARRMQRLPDTRYPAAHRRNARTAVLRTQRPPTR